MQCPVRSYRDIEFEVQTLNKVQNFIEGIGVDISIEDVQGLAVADIFEKTIRVNKDKRDRAWEKLPEEAAHFWYRLLKSPSKKEGVGKINLNPLKKELDDAIVNTRIYQEVLASPYFKKYKGDKEALKEEAIGQAIAINIKKLETDEQFKNAEEGQWFREWYRKFVQWIKGLLKMYEDVQTAPFQEAARQILNSDYSQLLDLDTYLYLQGAWDKHQKKIEEALEAEKLQLVDVVKNFTITRPLKATKQFIKSLILDSKGSLTTSYAEKEFSGRKASKQELENFEKVLFNVKSLSYLDSLKTKKNTKVAINKPIVDPNSKKGLPIPKKEAFLLEKIRKDILEEFPTSKSIEIDALKDIVDNAIQKEINIKYSQVKGYNKYRIPHLTDIDTSHVRFLFIKDDKVFTAKDHSFKSGVFDGNGFAWGTVLPIETDDNEKIYLIHETQTDILDNLVTNYQKEIGNVKKAMKDVDTANEVAYPETDTFQTAIGKFQQFNVPFLLAPYFSYNNISSLEKINDNIANIEDFYNSNSERFVHELEVSVEQAKKDLKNPAPYAEQANTVLEESYSAKRQMKSITMADKSGKIDLSFVLERFITPSLKYPSLIAGETISNDTIYSIEPEDIDQAYNAILDELNRVGYLENSQLKQAILRGLDMKPTSVSFKQFKARLFWKINNFIDNQIVDNTTHLRATRAALNRDVQKAEQIMKIAELHTKDAIPDLLKEMLQYLKDFHLSVSGQVEGQLGSTKTELLNNLMSQDISLQEGLAETKTLYNNYAKLIQEQLLIKTANKKDGTVYFAGGEVMYDLEGHLASAALYAGPEEVATDEEVIDAYNGATREEILAQNDDITERMRTGQTGVTSASYERARLFAPLYDKYKKFLKIGRLHTSIRKIKGAKVAYEKIPNKFTKTSKYAYKVNLENFTKERPELFALDLSEEEKPDNTEFDTLVQAVGENLAYDIWDKNNGNPLTQTPQGNTSLLFKELLNYTNDNKINALKLKAPVYATEYMEENGNWIENVGTLFDTTKGRGEPTLEDTLKVSMGNITDPQKNITQQLEDFDNTYRYTRWGKSTPRQSIFKKLKKEFPNLNIEIYPISGGQLKARAKANKNYFQLETEEEGKKEAANEQLNDILIRNLQKVGVTTKAVNRVVTESGKEGIAMVDIAKKALLYVEGKINIQSIPEEAAHILLAMLPKNSYDLERMKVLARQTSIYQEVLRDYKDVYESEEEFAFEAVGKIMSKYLVDEFKSLKASEDTTLLKRLASRIKAALKSLVDKFRGTNNSAELTKEGEAIFKRYANDILKGRLEATEVTNEDLQALKFYEIKDKDFEDYNKTQQLVLNSIVLLERKIKILNTKLKTRTGQGAGALKAKILELTNLRKSLDVAKEVQSFMNFLEGAIKEVEFARKAMEEHIIQNKDNLSLEAQISTLERIYTSTGAFDILDDYEEIIVTNKDKNIDRSKAEKMVTTAIGALHKIRTINKEYGPRLIAKKYFNAYVKGTNAEAKFSEESLYEWIKEAQFDESNTQYWFDAARSSHDPILALFAKDVAWEKEQAANEFREVKDKIADAYEKYKLYKGGNIINPEKHFDDLFHVYETTHYDEETDKRVKLKKAAFVGPLDYKNYWQSHEAFFSVKRTKKEAAEFLNNNRQIKKERTITLPDGTSQKFTSSAQEIVSLRRKLLGNPEFEKWKSKNLKGVNRYTNADNIVKVGDESFEVKLTGGELWEPNDVLYKDSQWDKIQQTPQLKEFYDTLVGSYLEGQMNIPPHKRRGLALPSVPKVFSEKIRSDGLLAATKEYLKEQVTYTAKDVKDVGIRTESGQELKRLPVFFTNPMDGDLVSKDVLSSVLSFYNVATNYKHMDNISSEVIIMQELMNPKNRKIRQGGRNKNMVDLFTESILKSLKVNGTSYVLSKESNTFSHLNDFIDMVYFGESHKTENWKIADKTFSGGKILNTIGKYVALNGLAFNFLSGVNNVIFGNVMIMQEAIAGQYFKRKHLREAYGVYSSSIPDILKDLVSLKKNTFIGQIIDLFEPIQGQFRDEYGTQLSHAKANKLFTSNILFFQNNIGEHAMQVGTMIAMMKAHELTVNGQTTNLWDALKNSVDENGRVQMPEGFDDKSKFNFKQKLTTLNNNLHGVYNDFDKGTIQKWALGRLAIQFRKWMKPGVNRRFEQGFFDFSTYAEKEGYYTTFGKYMRAWFSHLRGIEYEMTHNYSKLSDFQKQNLLRTATEFSSLLIVMVLIHAARGWVDDDDDDDWLANHVLYQALRLKSELMFYYNPQEVIRLMASPAAAVQTIKDTIKFGKQLFFNPMEKYERRTGSYDKGEYKLKARAKKMFPVIKQVERLDYPEQSVKWFDLFE